MLKYDEFCVKVEEEFMNRGLGDVYKRQLLHVGKSLRHCI